MGQPISKRSDKQWLRVKGGGGVAGYVSRNGVTIGGLKRIRVIGTDLSSSLPTVDF